MLDDVNLLNRNKVLFSLNKASDQCDQLDFKINILNQEHDNRVINNIIFINSSCSSSAALIAKAWLTDGISIPFEIVNSGVLPNYANRNSLVVLSDYAGNDSLVLDCLGQALECGSQVAIISSGGKLIENALTRDIAYAPLLIGLQPGMTTLCEFKAAISILSNFGLVTIEKTTFSPELTVFLRNECSEWGGDIPASGNYAKQLAFRAVGKSAIFYSGKYGISISAVFKNRWHDWAKNVAFSSDIPDFGCREATSWMSHPIEKNFSVFNIICSFEDERSQVQARILERNLSGKRPKTTDIVLKGDSLLGQLLWGAILADFSSIYLAALNNVSPLNNDLTTKLNKELSI